MPFTILASKAGQSAETQRIRPNVAAAKARALAIAGWDVYVTLPRRDGTFAWTSSTISHQTRTSTCPCQPETRVPPADQAGLSAWR